MDWLRLKQVTAIALSLWLGCLACVFGCVQPVSASALPAQRISELKATANQEDSDRMADSVPCCHHGGKTSRRSDSITVLHFLIHLS